MQTCAALGGVFNIPKAFGIQNMQHPIGGKNPENKEWLCIMNFVFSFYFLIFYFQLLLRNQGTGEPHNNILKSLLNYRQSKITDLIKTHGIFRASQEKASIQQSQAVYF